MGVQTSGRGREINIGDVSFFFAGGLVCIVGSGDGLSEERLLLVSEVSGKVTGFSFQHYQHLFKCVIYLYTFKFLSFS